MILFEKVYNFFIGMLIGLLIVYWVEKWSGGCRYVEEKVSEMD